MIWSRVYQPGPLTGGPSDIKDDELFALTELSRFGGTTTGDNMIKKRLAAVAVALGLGGLLLAPAERASAHAVFVSGSRGATRNMPATRR